MKRSYIRVVDDIIKESDLILNILDARFFDETRNLEIEKKIKSYGKKFIFVLNKCDTASNRELFRAVNKLKKITATIPVSCKDRHGKLRLIKAITYLVRKRPMIIGVVGYPNTGKSSVINYLIGRKKARTSSEAGFTKGKQWINLNKNIRLIDTPGVIPPKDRDKVGLVLKSSITRIEEPEEIATGIITFLNRKNLKILEKKYGIRANQDAVETLKEIAKVKHKLKKGGLLDLKGAAQIIIKDWQKGKLK
ncbi:50S ribosome-binding GTPase [Candidatus Woesearchaeota archaeon]|nr:50S ribosome-binding GTPase [Candidatus Woesearchaeota archaeon]